MRLPKRLGWSNRYARLAYLTVFSGLFLWLFCSFVLVYRLTHRSRPQSPEILPSLDWGPVEAHRIQTADGETLAAWYHEGRPDLPSVLLVHGNNGNRLNSLQRAGMLAKAGHSVLLISQRAHGDSTGSHNDIGFSGRLDVLASVAFLERRRPGGSIVIHGVSSGSAAAVFAAEELGDRVAGYWLESPYRDLKTAVWNRMSMYLPVGLNWVGYVGARIAGVVLLPNVEAISPIDRVTKIPEAIPVLIVAGGQDRHAKVEEAEAIHDRIRSHARLEVFAKAQHHTVIESEPGRYSDLLRGFCASPKLFGK